MPSSTSKINGNARSVNNFNYQNLSKNEDDIITESQFHVEDTQSTVPVKAIAIAVFMFFCGIILIVYGHFIVIKIHRYKGMGLPVVQLF